MKISDLASCFRLVTLTDLKYLCETHKIEAIKVRGEYRVKNVPLAVRYLKTKWNR